MLYSTADATQYSMLSPVDASASTMELALKVALIVLGCGGPGGAIATIAPAPSSAAGTVAAPPAQPAQL